MSEQYKNAVCRGSWALGSACGKCERCIETNPHKSKHMSEQNTEFENWFEKQYGAKPQPNPKKGDAPHSSVYMTMFADGAYRGWSAKTAEANKRINALESEVERKDSLLRALENVADELKASNNTLVKVLRIARQKLMLNSRGFVYSNLFVDINEALKATPAESLQAHDDELIEKIINIIKSETDKFNNVDSLLYIIEILDNMKVNHETTKTP